MSNDYPTLDQFLGLPIPAVSAVAPNTIIWAPGGTRREHMLAKQNENYPESASLKMIESNMLFSKYGIRHVVQVMLTEGNYKERTAGYSEKIDDWTYEWLTKPQTIEICNKYNWRLRLIGGRHSGKLNTIDKMVADLTKNNTGTTFWYTIASHAEDRWTELFDLCHKQRITSREEAIHALYGEDIPLAEIFIGSVKPRIFASIIPPLLVGSLDCYWRMRPGYSLTENELRSIIYDHAYLRVARHERNATSTATNTPETTLKWRSAWENPDILGIGMKLGPYWYPSAFRVPEDILNELKKNNQ